MNIKIFHYEPGQDRPYDEEAHEDIRSFQYDSLEKEIFFIQKDGTPYRAEYRHHIIFEISNGAAELGRKGGSQTSERKAAAVRENGKKGGRPKRVKAE